ncbi:MAG TPA: M20 family metallopeptidase [Chloroflexi bacterium]|nr:MAG: hypothetical protein B6243_05400 [Anaerolineaceae bacterium 4572_5.2]HEY84036.1 M20 family metallopeptidase [Chloroflexota bacterium]
MSKTMTYLKAQQDDMVETLRRWVNHDSPTFNKEATDSMGQLIARTFEETGAHLQTHPQEKYGNHHTLIWRYPGATEQILLLGHFDTVWPDGEAVRRPFRVENGIATGPGSNDMKVGLVLVLFAMRSIQALNLKPAKNIALVLNSEEEISSPTSRPIIEAEAERSRYALVLEPAREGNLITWRKGIGRFEMTITGKAVHAGVEPEKGISAIEELARQILELHAMSAPQRGISVNVGVVNGGTRSNVVAAKAKALIDLRVKTQADGERMVKAILNLQPKLPGADLEISGKLSRPPFEETPAGLLLFKKAQGIAAELGFKIGKIGTGGGSDGNFSAALGIPTLDGLGNVGSGSHALSEHTVVDTFPQRAALLAELMLAL